LIRFTDKGLYCEAGGFYIDPWRPVDRAVITHAHSDHAKAGCGSYLCHYLTLPLLQLRLGEHPYHPIGWNEQINMNGVKLSLHPAGHIIGSSQVRLEYKGEVWVFSGDYKTENDGISGAFEPVKCHTFITESTFALPIYKWKPQQHIYNDIGNWIRTNQANEKTSVLIAYSLGKAQRVLEAITEVTGNIYAHGAVYNTHQVLVGAGIKLPEIKRVWPDTPKEQLKGSVVIAPPGAAESSWMKRFTPYAVGVCSGWMQVRGNARRNNVDWPGLLSAIKETGAEKVYATHGFQSALSRYLNEQGIEAAEVKTEYGDEENDESNQTEQPEQ
jgi:putative mRNA 3-end processing factor